MKVKENLIVFLQVGCNQKDEYSSEFKWWEHSYNRAAKKVSESLDKGEKEDKQVKKRKHKDEDNEDNNETIKKSIYSRFEKVIENWF